MVRIGIIGIGFMGYTHFEGARDLLGGKVTGIATRDAAKLAGDWTSIQGNFGPPGGHVDVSDLKCCSDYHDLLNDPDIDLIDVCLPTDKHHQVVMESLRAGKPTLVEKPISVDLTQAQEMVAAAERAGVPLYVAHVLPFFPEFRFAAEAVQDGRFGSLKAAHFKRVICPPDWSNDMSDFRKLGGWGIDLHIHDNHFIAHACGTPQAVFSRGLLQDGFVNHVHSSYVYDNGPAVTCVSGGIAARGLQFGHGYELYFDDATLMFDAGTYAGEWVVSRPLSVIRNDGTIENPELGGSGKWCGAFTDELQLAIDALQGKRDPGPIAAHVALAALQMCWAEAESIASGTSARLSG
ncbi:MAG: Gfo/Idh/MocA family oxidoreductase [Planctomycetaceae bacterium]|nr:Gfo/Idh/MocA family oxidoreductase [Planctomycetaceae bacterium]